MHKTRLPSAAKQLANPAQSVVFPVPPFPEVTAIICPKAKLPLYIASPLYRVFPKISTAFQKLFGQNIQNLDQLN